MSEPSAQQTLNEFDPASYDAWLKLVERDLKGASFEKKLVKQVAGIPVAPLYVRSDAAPDGGYPGFAPHTRGAHALGHVEAGWDVRQRISHAEVGTAARAVGEELRGGATSVMLTFDAPTRGPGGAPGRVGIACANLADLDQLLAAVALDKTPVALDAGEGSPYLAAGLFALARRRGIDARLLGGSLGADPLGALARFGGLSTSIDTALTATSALASYAHAHAPQLRSLSIDLTPYHEAGADAAFELALALATGVTYLRCLTGAGMALDDAARQLEFRIPIGRDFFLEIAKLRAARTLWSKVVLASGGQGDAAAMRIHGTTSLRTKTARDPWVNLLRTTTESLAAALGGAEAITAGSFDEVLGESDEFARHLARNTQHVLRHEAHIHRVIDAPGGSFYLESLTYALARRAWTVFQDLERRGPLPELLTAGTLQMELRGALDAETRAVETRSLAITGVNEFPHVRETALPRNEADAAALAPAWRGDLAGLGETFSVERAIEALEKGASFGALRAHWADGRATRVPELTRTRLAEPFEQLRDAADRFLAGRGHRPRVFLANLGPIPAHKARAQFTQNLVESGGFEAISNDGFERPADAASAFVASGAEVCALCSSDEVYAALALDAAQAISKAGPKALVLAGKPGERESQYRAAGVTHFVFAGMNAVDLLRSLLALAGAA